MSEILGDDLCFCGQRSVMRTSWTDANPGRRFLSCARSRLDACRFFVWVDHPMCDRARIIIPGLLRRLTNQDNEIEMLKNQKKKLMNLLLIMIVVIVLLFLFIVSNVDGRNKVAHEMLLK